MNQKVASCLIPVFFMIMCRTPVPTTPLTHRVVVDGCRPNDSCAAQLLLQRSFTITTGISGASLPEFHPSSTSDVLWFRSERRATKRPDGYSGEEIILQWQKDHPKRLTQVVYGRFGFAGTGYESIDPTLVVWETEDKRCHLRFRPPGRRSDIDLFFTVTDRATVP